MNRDRFLNPDGKKSKAYIRSSSQEKMLAKRSGGKEVHRSGASNWDKGDVRGYRGRMTVEAKTTSRKSFSVTRDTMVKLEDAASSKSELPVLIIEWLDSVGSVEGELAVVPMWVLDDLLNNQKDVY